MKNFLSKIQEWISKHDLLLITIFLIAISVSAFFYFYFNNLIISYGDARAHLNIARRVSDNLTPGLAQLGGVWLPLLHALMLPTIWSNFMWHSGISGSIVSIPAYIISMLFLYKLAILVTGRRIAGLIALAVAALNINLLYLQSTPMTEALFICTLVLAVYYMTMWVKSQQIPHLLFSGLFIFLTAINRYEGWAVALASVVALWVLSYLRKGAKYAEGRTIIFASIALLGIMLWFVWQTIIFNNPVYFLSSEYSAKGQTLISISERVVPTYKNLVISILTGVYALLHVNGVIAVAFFAFSLPLFTIYILTIEVERKKIFNYIPLYLLIVPFSFLDTGTLSGKYSSDCTGI